jgi:hypothetical protein
MSELRQRIQAEVHRHRDHARREAELYRATGYLGEFGLPPPRIVCADPEAAKLIATLREIAIVPIQALINVVANFPDDQALGQAVHDWMGEQLHELHVALAALEQGDGEPRCVPLARRDGRSRNAVDRPRGSHG